jgi:hypothetical protein
MVKNTKLRCRSSKPRNGEVVNGAVEREFSALLEEVIAGETDAVYWPAFPLGRLVITRGVVAKLSPEDAWKGVVRHGQCDWGDLEREDREVNLEALKRGKRLLSRYRTGEGITFYVLTEGNRSVTTVLLPEEY